MMSLHAAAAPHVRSVTGSLVSACLYVALAAMPSPMHAQILDRILAVVDGAPIMQSDVVAAIDLGLVRTSGTPDPVAAVLDRLIERRLMLADVERYAPPEPPEAAVDSSLAEKRAQIGSRVDQILQRTGLTLDQLRRHVRDDLRIDAYLQQRFGDIVPPEQDIVQYYADHAVEFQQRPLDQVREQVRAALVGERRTGTIKDWVAGLRRRANINVLPR